MQNHSSLSKLSFFQSQKPKEIDELKEAVREYKEALKRAKSQQTFNNYHKNFLKNLGKKVERSHEKQLNKVRNLIKPSLSTWNNFDILPVLFENQTVSVYLKIPTTLYYSNNAKFLIESKSKLKFFTGPNIFNQFLRDLPVFSDKPICLFKPFNSKLILFNNISTLQEFFHKNTNDFGYYQYFIPPFGKNASLLTVHTKLNCFNKYYLLKNTSNIDTTSKNEKKIIISDENSGKIMKMHVQKVLNTFKHNKLKRQATFEFPDLETSIKDTEEEEKIYFSSQNRTFSSLIQRIKSINTGDKTSALSTSVQNEKNFEKFLVNSRKPRNINFFKINTPIPTVEKMTFSLFSLVNSFFKQKFHKDIEEISFSFIRESKETWKLLKIKTIKCLQPCDVEEVNINSISVDESSFSLINQDPSTLITNAFLPIVDSIVKFKEKEKEKEKEKIRVKSFRHLKAKSSVQELNLSQENPIFKKKIVDNIDTAVFQYDLMMTKIKIKPNIPKLAAKYRLDVFWKEFSIKMHRAIVTSPISKYFTKSSSDRFYSISRSMLRIVNSEIDMKFRNDVKNFHQFLKISLSDFNTYKQIFFKCLNEYNVGKNDLEIIIGNFYSMKNLIVSSY